MDNGTLIGILCSVISALFGYLQWEQRRRADDWKGLYQVEKDGHETTRRQSSAEIQKTSEAFVKSVIENAKTNETLEKILVHVERREAR